MPTYPTTPVGIAELLCTQLLRPLKGSVRFPGVSPACYRTRTQPPAASCRPYGMDLMHVRLSKTQ